MGLFLAGVLGFTLVVGVHEFGHFTFCKIFNISTPVFSIGFGPPIIHKKIGDTNFVLSAIPLGGYVEIRGMTDSWSSDTRIPHDATNPNSFARRPYYQKLLVLLGGILFNLIFGFLLFWGLAWSKKAPAPETEDNLNHPKNVSETAKNFKQLFKAPGTRRLTGPIGILNIAMQSAAYGPRVYILFLAVLSINLAFFNLLPIPVFDGGQLLLTTIEAIQGHSIAPHIRTAITSITTIILLLGIVYITFRDIKN